MSNTGDILIGSAKSPYLAFIMEAKLTVAAAHCRRVVLKFGECAQLSLDVACLNRTTAGARAFPGDVDVLPGRIHSEVPDHQRAFLFSPLQISNPSGDVHNREPYLLLAFRVHVVTDVALGNSEVSAVDVPEVRDRRRPGKCRYDQGAAMWKLQEIPDTGL